MNQNQNNARFNLHVPNDVKRIVRVKAAMRDLSMQEYIRIAIEEKIQRDSQEGFRNGK